MLELEEAEVEGSYRCLDTGADGPGQESLRRGDVSALERFDAPIGEPQLRPHVPARARI